jgi:N6-L-threonylcarbamoyladenine synthase
MALEKAGLDGRRPPVDAVAATFGPGLIGSLLVGLSAAKGLATGWGVPFVGVNHLEGHLFATLLEAGDDGVSYPLVVLLVSGGHTMLIEMSGPGRYRLLGQTLDDAAGEAYDKVARYLGLGYPGGPAIDRVAKEGDPTAFAFPRSMLDEGYDFSFSGLKTAVVRTVDRLPDSSTVDVAASFQEAVVDVLVAKAGRAVLELGASGLCLAGGVAANSLLRSRAASWCADHGVVSLLPSLAFCTDNAAMVAAAGRWRLLHEGASPASLGAEPNLRLPITA